MKKLFTNFTKLNSSKWALLLMTFTLSANAQVIECQPVKRIEYFITRGNQYNFDCKTAKCEKLTVDVAGCEKNTLSYICKEDKSDDKYEEKFQITINRINSTAERQHRIINRSSNDHTEYLRTYDSCAILNVTPKL